MSSPEPEAAPVKAPALSQLANALALVQSQLPRIGKDETGKVQGEKNGKVFSYTYTYADLASVSRAILPLLGKHGLSFIAFPTLSDRGGIVLRYSLLHESGESMTGEYPITGTTAQQQGSSITYARRYCLCAVTGIAPDEDDDAAGADGAREAQEQAVRDERVAADSAEYNHAANAVQGAWASTVGTWDQVAAAKTFHGWSKGQNLRDADAATLRRFAAYLEAQPKEDAGTPPEAGPPADVAMITPRQRGKLFALMGEIGIHDKGDQLRWINSQLRTEYESRTLITFDDAKQLIDALQKGVGTEATTDAG